MSNYRFTTDDVYAASFAARVRSEAQAEGETPESIIRSHLYADGADERRQERDELAKFRRGCTILDAGYTVVTGTASVDPWIDEPRAVSPAVRQGAGHIGTNAMFVAAVLVPQ